MPPLFPSPPCSRLIRPNTGENREVRVNSCCICHKTGFTPEFAANDNTLSKPPIHLPSVEEICQTSCVRRLAMVYRAKNLPRRKVLDFVAEHLFFHDVPILQDGLCVFFDDDLDEVFGAESDPSQRWMGDFLAFAVEPPRQKAQRRIADRLLRLWVALAVHSREQAEHVIR